MMPLAFVDRVDDWH